MDISVLQLQLNAPVMPVVGALYCLLPAVEITQNMPLAHSIANPIWFLISYYCNLVQIYCITTTTENPQPPPRAGWNQFYPRSFFYNKTAEKSQVDIDFTGGFTRLDFEMFICFLAPGHVFREH